MLTPPEMPKENGRAAPCACAVPASPRAAMPQRSVRDVRVVRDMGDLRCAWGDLPPRAIAPDVPTDGATVRHLTVAARTRPPGPRRPAPRVQPRAGPSARPGA